MIRIADIQDALLHVVGWEQGWKESDRIDDGLTETESGLTFQGAHPLVTLSNIRSIIPEEFAFEYPAFTPGQYAAGAKRSSGGKVYKCEVAGWYDSPEGWTEMEMSIGLSAYVENLTRQAIAQVVQTFMQTKQLARETKSLMERRALFDGAARLQSRILPTGKLVGLEIIPVRAMGVTTKIERIGLQMIGGTGEITMYLFHSSQSLPVRTIRLQYTNTSGAFQWFTPAEPVYLPYIGTGTDAGGAWLLCYNQNDLPDGMRALNVTKDWSKEPCQTCLGGSLESWRELTKYLQISPFCIKSPAGYAGNPTMPDIGELAYTNTMNYGINLEISVGCDLSDFIISQRMVFANVIQRQVAVNVLRTIAMNPEVRVNRNQVNVTRDQILYEVDGIAQGRPSGLAYELQQSYKALEIDTQGLDRVCLKCNNHGVKYRTA